jgi:hypothetical protein
VNDPDEGLAGFRRVFGADLRPFDKRWQDFILGLEPPPVSVAVQRLEFLGQALVWMRDQPTLPEPDSLEKLKTILQAIRFQRIETAHHGEAFRTEASDEMFVYPDDDGVERAFDMLEPSAADLPPRLEAAALKPAPMLVWHRDVDGELIPDIRFR